MSRLEEKLRKEIETNNRLNEELNYYRNLCNQFCKIIDVKQLNVLIKLINESHLMNELCNPIDKNNYYGRK